MRTYDNNRYRRTDLNYLDQLDDFKVHEDDTDVRGWNIYDRTGMKFGEITNLIVDPTERRTRYVVVELDDNNLYNRDLNFFERVGEDIKDFFGDDNDRNVIVPVGMLSIDDDDNKVNIFNYDTNYLSNGPRFTYDTTTFVSPNFELATARYYSLDDETNNDYYRQSRYRFDNEPSSSSFSNDRTFYDSSLFDGRRFNRNTQNANSTTMASVDTGSKRF